MAAALLSAAAPALADGKSETAEVVDPHEIVDPEEVVSDDGRPVSSGPPGSLCIVQQSPARATLLFIPYATYDMWRPCRGKNRESMTYAEFYAAIGRPDLLEAHKSRETTGTILGVTQIGLTLGAVGFAAVALFKEDADYWWPAGGCLLGAMTAGVIRGSRPPLPIDSDEALRLADAYNDGAAPAPTSRSRQVPLDPQLSALGFVLPVVSGRF